MGPRWTLEFRRSSFYLFLKEFRELRTSVDGRLDADPDAVGRRPRGAEHACRARRCRSTGAMKSFGMRAMAEAAKARERVEAGRGEGRGVHRRPTWRTSRSRSSRTTTTTGPVRRPIGSAKKGIAEAPVQGRARAGLRRDDASGSPRPSLPAHRSRPAASDDANGRFVPASRWRCGEPRFFDAADVAGVVKAHLEEKMALARGARARVDGARAGGRGGRASPRGHAPAGGRAPRAATSSTPRGWREPSRRGWRRLGELDRLRDALEGRARRSRRGTRRRGRVAGAENARRRRERRRTRRRTRSSLADDGGWNDGWSDARAETRPHAVFVEDARAERRRGGATPSRVSSSFRTSERFERGRTITNKTGVRSLRATVESLALARSERAAFEKRAAARPRVRRRAHRVRRRRGGVEAEVPSRATAARRRRRRRWGSGSRACRRGCVETPAERRTLAGAAPRVAASRARGTRRAREARRRAGETATSSPDVRGGDGGASRRRERRGGRQVAALETAKAESWSERSYATRTEAEAAAALEASATGRLRARPLSGETSRGEVS